MRTKQIHTAPPAAMVDDELGIQCPICRADKGTRCKWFGAEQGSHLERHAEWLLHLAEMNVISERGMPLWNSVLLIVEQLPEAEYLLWRDRNFARLRKLAFDAEDEPEVNS